ncbi:phytanoyl-CoA dioxygenase family protein [Paenibacillus agricola]|uniref:Phytanoyl-CoA dioxygenase family protein n=1 Tax=Paenibacillus agricola TaxID=2716264 RepID=A0ABX0J8U9_9BACL|nr:phytanoyl-CoA dioxygenase family protein [Paenibacillus agricola]NHN32780.1 phytanoyl-CoA dioxygenase family protein [Paenibacillus agricola]
MSEIRLTGEQKSFYKENGYLIGLPPVYAPDEMNQLQDGLKELTDLLHEGEQINDIIYWERESKWLYDISANPQILNYVEDILGPHFYQWGTEFFAKAPHSSKVVPWHQDGYYYPFTPQNKTITVWLAFTEVDEENGAMKVIPGTHNKGLIRHRKADLSGSYLTLELDEGTYTEETAVSLTLQPGEMSIHHDCIVHGSPANVSDRWRIGLTLHYSSTEVKCDTTKNPGFKCFLMRGIDEFKHNQIGTIPTKPFGRIYEKYKTPERTE